MNAQNSELFESDILEQILPILDTQFELGEPCDLSKDLLDEIKQFPKFKNIISPITDPQYDEIKKRLKQLRPELFEKDGKFEGTTASQADFTAAKKIIHNPPMTSIKKADGDLQEKTEILNKFMCDCIKSLNYTENNSHSKIPFALSYKRDGVSVRLYYVNGKLAYAGVRPRDGINGADVLKHIKKVKNIPITIPDNITCAVTGELEILLKDFEIINKERADNGDKLLANPRNATAGAMNPLGDPNAVTTRRINFIGHALHMENPPYETAIERAKYAREYLKIPFVEVEFYDYKKLAEMEENVPKLGYEVDGVVIEVNWLDDAESLGQHGGSLTGEPIARIAWKFLEQHARPVVKGIKWQPGRTGKITPVAFFDAVRLAGTNVTNCTLHNIGKVLNSAIGVGAIIEIYKAGKIIPYISEVIKSAKIVDYPKACPACGYKTSIKEGATGRDLWCDNEKCPAKSIGTFVHYLSTFGVKGIAESMVTSMIEAGLLHTYADFYKIKPEDLVDAGLGERESLLAYARIHMIDGADQIKNDNLLHSKAEKASKLHKEISIEKLIAALGIDGASKGTGRELSDHFRDFDKIMTATVDQFVAVPNIGLLTANSVFNFFIKNKTEILELLKFVAPIKPCGGKFNNLTFVFTGGQELGKDYWNEKVQNEGGKIGSGVSKKINFLVVGENPGSKLDKAEELVEKGLFIDMRGNLPSLISSKGQIIDIDGLQKLLNN